MIRRLLLPLILLSYLATSLLAAPRVMAATGEACGETSKTIMGAPTWYKYLNPRFENNECKIDFAFPEDIGKVALAAFEIILFVSGIIAVIFVVYGGIQYILSQGEPDRMKGARSSLINALIGLVIALSATAIVNLIGRNLG